MTYQMQTAKVFYTSMPYKAKKNGTFSHLKLLTMLPVYLPVQPK